MGITPITSTIMKTRDVLVAAAVFSALEAVALNAFAPHLRPAGGVGRLLERFFIANIILVFLYSILIRPYFVSPLRPCPQCTPQQTARRPVQTMDGGDSKRRPHP